MPLSKIKTNSVATGNITSPLIASVANTAIVGRIPAATAPAGSVIQIVQGKISTNFTTTSNSPVNTGLTATITPTSTTSKILVMIHTTGSKPANSEGRIYAYLYRNSSDIHSFARAAGYNATNVINYFGSISTSYLDNPNTTSATTYTFYVAGYASQTITVHQDNAESTITLMEIAV
jgi:hypothetical protein